MIPGSGPKPEAGVHDPAFSRDRLAAHVKCARAVHSDVARARRQGQAWEIQTFDTEEPHVRTMRAGDHAQFTILSPGAGYRDADCQAAAVPAVAAHGAVLVPADVGDALDNANPL